MGDYHQSVVDVEASALDARKLADKVSRLLIARGVVAGRKTDCVLGARSGYPPGPKFADACARGADDDHLTRLTNGLEIVTKRTVFDAGGNGLEIVCPACGHGFEDADDQWMEAVEDWWGGNDAASYGCPKCRRKSPLNSWDGPWPWAFGNLGFTFWNWPPLKKKFVAELADTLGHRVRVVLGRL